MDSKNILITGSGSGLGRAMAIRLAFEGHNIILNGRTESKLIGTKNMIKQNNVETLIEVGDISDSQFVESMISDIVSKLEILHVTINNAGISGKPGSLLRTSEEQMEEIMNINFKGTWLVSKHAAKAMKKQKDLAPLRGKIINISSIAGLDPSPSLGIYSCSKAAINSLTKAMAKELAPKITVNAICPGYHLTPILNNNPDLARAMWKEDNREPLMKRVGTAEDVAGLTSFLVSDDSNYMTGQVINVCGGAILH